MSFFHRFRKEKKSPPKEVREPSGGLPEFDPEAHHILLEYLRSLWEGAPPDPIFEQKSLSRDLHFDTLNLAEVIFAVSKAREIPVDRIADFLRCGIPGGGDTQTANLLQRIAILADSFSEAERDSLLASGVIGDPNEIAPITPHFDYVWFVVKYCRAIESLKEDETFGRRHGGYVEIEDDPGWQ